jgi:hypothetical protein
MYTIAVKPSKTLGKVIATSSDGASFLSRQPLLDGARHWATLGAPAGAAIVTVWSSGSTDWSLRSTIGHAASKTVRDSDHHSPHFVDWTPFPTT